MQALSPVSFAVGPLGQCLLFSRGKKMNRNINDWEPFSSPLGFIRLVLLVDWDPIGIFGHAGAMNEYDTYAREIYNLLDTETSEEELISCLRQIESERMGVGSNPNMSLLAVAVKLQDVFKTARADED